MHSSHQWTDVNRICTRSHFETLYHIGIYKKITWENKIDNFHKETFLIWQQTILEKTSYFFQIMDSKTDMLVCTIYCPLYTYNNKKQSLSPPSPSFNLSFSEGFLNLPSVPTSLARGSHPEGQGPLWSIFVNLFHLDMAFNLAII